MDSNHSTQITTAQLDHSRVIIRYSPNFENACTNCDDVFFPLVRLFLLSVIVGDHSSCSLYVVIDQPDVARSTNYSLLLYVMCDMTALILHVVLIVKYDTTVVCVESNSAT